MTFRSALLYSAALHMTFMAARPFHGMPTAFALTHSLEVTYEPAPVPPVLPPAEPRSVFGIERAPSVPARPMTSAAPVRAAAVRSAAVPQRAAPAVPVRASAPPARPAPEMLPPARVQAMPEWQFAQLQHKEQVRKYLKSHLNYPSVLMTGTVRLRLVLLPDGKLQQVEVLESSDPRLVQAALRDARSSEPYPAFPGVLRRRQVTYDYLVRYEPE